VKKNRKPYTRTKNWRPKTFSKVKLLVDALNLNPANVFVVDNAKDRVLAARHAKRLEKSGKLKFPISTRTIRNKKTGKATGKFSVFSIPS
jgi:hypothetical protein